MRRLVITFVTLGLLGGCATTTVYFESPEGTEMQLNGKTYVWPAKVELARPGEEGEQRVYNLKMVIPADGEKLRAKGELHVFAFQPTDVDKYARNDCSIDLEHLKKLKDGYAVTVDGYSAGRKSRLYRIILGREE
ncbi:MAG: hypothetical protein ACYTF6_03675 [Planctomycetota bacterium]|jgi:hypothetical protein